MRRATPSTWATATTAVALIVAVLATVVVIVQSSPVAAASVSPIPGVVEAEDYVGFADNGPGNEGRAVSFTDDVDVWPIRGSDGYILGRVFEGEYTTYDVSVADAGTFEFALSHASGADGGTATVSVDGAPIGPAVALGSTGGWWEFTATAMGRTALDVGSHTVRVDWGPGQSNFDHIEVTRVDDASPNPAAAEATTVSVQVTSGIDDVEELADGTMYFNSTDLEFAYDNNRGTQSVGLRFGSVPVPSGATIVSASLEFTADEIDGQATNLAVGGERSADPAPFSAANGDLTDRARISRSVPWSPGSWNQVGQKYTSPDLSAIVGEMVHVTGWAEGNPMVFIVSGSGQRVAESFEGDAANAPKLTITYETAAVAPTPTATPVPDVSAPSRPGWAQPFWSSSVDSLTATWKASTDDVGVVGYRVELRGVETVEVAASSREYTFDGVAPGRYYLNVVAFDAAANTSPRRALHVRVQSPSQQDQVRVEVVEIAAAIEAFVAAGGEFTEIGGSNGQGWFHLSNGSSYPAKMSSTLIDAGFLDARFGSIDYSDYMVYRCGSGDETRVGVFADMPQTEPIGATDEASWDGCTKSPFYYAHNYYVVTKTQGEIRNPIPTPTPTPGPGPEATTVSVQISAGVDDVEELADGTMYFDSTDLEMVNDVNRGDVTVGLRFGLVPVPRGATITSASLEFTADEVDGQATSLSIGGERSANPAPFTAQNFDLTSRLPISRSVSWTPGSWSQIGAKYTSPDLTAIVQEMVSITGRADDAPMVFTVSGSGQRVADSFEGSAADAPTLTISYETSAPQTALPVRFDPLPDENGEARTAVIVEADGQPLSSVALSVTYNTARLQMTGCDVEMTGGGACNPIATGLGGRGEILIGGFVSSEAQAGDVHVATLEYRREEAARNANRAAKFQAADFDGEVIIDDIGSGLGSFGDANCDGGFNIADAYVVSRLAVGLERSFPGCPNPAGTVNILAGDVTGDGEVNILDAYQIARCAVGLDEEKCSPPAAEAVAADDRYNESLFGSRRSAVEEETWLKLEVEPGGSSPVANTPGRTALSLTTTNDVASNTVACLIYRTEQRNSSGSWSTYQGRRPVPVPRVDVLDPPIWVHAPDNCQPVEPNSQIELVGQIFPATQSQITESLSNNSDEGKTNIPTYRPGEYRVYWQVIAWEAGSLETMYKSKNAPEPVIFEVPEEAATGDVGPEAITPSAVLGGSTKVMLVAEAGFAEYEWSLQPNDGEEGAECVASATTTENDAAPANTVTLDIPGDGEDFLWCVRAKVDVTPGALMAYSPWTMRVLKRSDETRNRLFGSSPLDVNVEGVNAASGNWSFSRTDVALAGVAPGLAVNRIYNSQAPGSVSGAFGRGWSASFESRLQNELVSSSSKFVYSYPDGDKYETRTEQRKVELLDSMGREQGVWFIEQVNDFKNGALTHAQPNVLDDDDASTKLTFVDPGWHVTARDGSRLEFDADGRLLAQVDPLGRRLEYNREPDRGNIDLITDTITGRQISLDWSAGGRVIEVTVDSPSGSGGRVSWTYHYDESAGDQLVRVCRPPIADEAGVVCESYEWDPDKLAIASVFSGRIYTSAESGVLVNPAEDGQPNYTVEYNDDLTVKFLQSWPEIDGPANVTTFDYEKRLFEPGAATTVTDARNNVWRYTFNQDGQVIEKDLPDVEAHDGTSLAGVTRYQYEEQRRTLVVTPNATDPSVVDGARFLYDDDGNLTRSIDGNGESTYLYYDFNDMLKAECAHEAGPDDSASEWCVRSTWAGRLLKERTTTIATGQDAIEKWEYGTNSQVKTHIDAQGRVTNYDYYVAGEGGGRPGDLKAVTYPSGLKHRMIYNAWGQVGSTFESWTDPDAGTPESWDDQGEFLLSDIDYNAVGLVSIRTGPKTTNEVDQGEHRLVEMTTYNPELTVASIESWDSRDVSATRRTTNFYYDGLDREIESRSPEVDVVNSNGGVVRSRPTIVRTLDANGNVKTVTDANGVTTTTVYDERNQPLTVTKDDETTRTWHTDTGQVEKIEDASGRTRYFTYDQAGRRVTTYERDNSDGAPWLVSGHVSSYVSGTSWPEDVQSGGEAGTGNVPGAVGRLAKQTTKDYGPSGLVMETIEKDRSGDRATETTYFDDGQPKQTTVSQNGLSTTTTYTYDAGGYLEVLTEDAGRDNFTTTTDHDPRGQVRSITDGEGNETTFLVDRAGRSVRTTEPETDTYANHGSAATVAVSVTKTGIDAFGNVVSVKDAAGNVTTSRYDVLDRLVSVEHPTLNQAGEQPLTPSETFRYDANGNLREEVARTGGKTTYEYDAYNRVELETQPVPQGQETAPVTAYEYDGVGNLKKLTDPNDVVTEFSYNQWNQVLTESVTRSAQTISGVPREEKTLVWTSTYDELGHLESETTPEQITTTYQHDSLGRLLTVTEPGNRQTTMTYDYADRLLTSADPRGFTTETVHDGAARTTSTTQFGLGDGRPAISRITTTYDGNGNPLTDTTAGGVTTTYAWDARQRLASSTTLGEPAISNAYGYDARNNLAWFRDGRSNVTTHTWNEWNLKSTTREPRTDVHPATADRDYTMIYDEGGRTVRQVQPGAGVDIQVDQLGRVRREETTDNHWRTLDYDAAGRLTSVDSNEAAEVTFIYDDLGLLLESTGGGTNSTFDYDDDGRMTRRTDSGTAAHLYTWTDNNELKSHKDGITGLTSTFGRAADGRLDQIDIGTNVARTFSYHPDGRLNADRWLTDGVLVNERIYETYDDDNNVTLERRLQYGSQAAECDTAYAVNCQEQMATTVRYDFDSADRLSSFDYEHPTTNGSIVESKTTYTYDAAGNRVTREADGAVDRWEYDARNRLTSGPEGAYSWSPRGTLESITSAGATVSYGFDGFGNMSEAAGVTYDYDGLGRLATRTEGNTPATFGYSGLGRDQVWDGSARYGRSPDGRLTSVLDGGAGRVAGVDRYGDLMLLTDTAGAPVETITFEPFGSPLVRWGSVDAAVGFQSDWTDPTTGDVNMDARWYASSSGTFRSRDTWMGTLRTPVSLNRYTYGSNNPIRYWDPSGMSSEGFQHTRLQASIEAAEAQIASAVAIAANSSNSIGTGNFGLPSLPDGADAVTSSNTGGALQPVNTQTTDTAAGEVSKILIHAEHERAVTNSSATRHSAPDFSFADFAHGAYDGGRDSVTGIRDTLSLLGRCGGAAVTGRLCEEFIATKQLLTDVYGAASSGDLRGALTIIAGAVVPEECWTRGIDYCAGYVVASVVVSMGAAGAAGRVAGALDNFTPSIKVNGPDVDAPARSSPRVNCALQSFSGGTGVVMADGTITPIAEIEVGDAVWSINPETGASGARAVQAVWPHKDVLIEFTVDGGSVTTTEDHEFWNVTDAAWQETQDIDEGDFLLASDGALVAAGSLRWGTAHYATAYDLTIDDTHTYFVAAGRDAVLVHNTDGCVNGSSASPASPARNSLPSEVPPAQGGSPALPWNDWSPIEVNLRQTELRRQLGTGNLDPDSPIPDQSPGQDMGGHPANEHVSHDGQRNIGAQEEHKRREAGNQRYGF